MSWDGQQSIVRIISCSSPSNSHLKYLSSFLELDNLCVLSILYKFSLSCLRHFIIKKILNINFTRRRLPWYYLSSFLLDTISILILLGFLELLWKRYYDYIHIREISMLDVIKIEIYFKGDVKCVKWLSFDLNWRSWVHGRFFSWE